MGDTVIRVLVFVIFIIPDDNRGIITEAVATHQCKVVLKRASAYRIATPLIFGQRICAGVNQVVDSPAPVMILQALVYR